MRIKRILLIQPSVTSFVLGDFTPNMPLGLAYIAASLQEYNYDVRILDTVIEGWNNINRIHGGRFQIGLDNQEIENRIRDFQPEMVGISSMFSAQWHNVNKITELVKDIDKNIITVVGGVHPTVMPEGALGDNNVDFVVIGEGEKTFLNLIKALENNERLDNINGVAFRQNGKQCINKNIEYVADLDELPFPARHILPLEKYFSVGLSHGGRRKRKRFTSLLTSRGCSARCIFCSVFTLWGRNYRARSAENVIAEIKLLKNQFGIEEISIEDDNFTFDKMRTHEILDRLISEQLNVAWDTPNGIAAYTLDEELIRKMRESGCYRLNFPIESGNQGFLLKNIKKPLQLDGIPRLIDYAKHLGLEVGAFFVLGIPGETERTLKDTFNFTRKIGIYNPFISIATPYPGTPLLELCINNGYLVKDFSLINLSITQFNIQTPQLSIHQLKKLIRKELLKLSCYNFLHLLRKPQKIIRKLLNKIQFRTMI